MKKFVSIALVLVMILTLGAFSALAADKEPAELHDLSTAVLSKKLNVANAIDISAVDTFEFTFAPQAGTGTTLAEAQAILAGDVSVKVAKVAGEDLAVGNKALSDLFKIADFPHAGEYVWNVTEKTADSSADGKTLDANVNNDFYIVRIYVINTETGLAFSGLTVEDKDGNKVDPTPVPENHDVSGFVFENTYTELIQNPLTVTKAITGAYADKTKEFAITVELTLPATASASDIVLDDASAGTLSGTTVTANLADGGQIIFKQLPAGTTFVVKETQQSPYQSKTTGFVAEEDAEYVTGNVDKAGKAAITASGNQVRIENNREDIIPTGVIIDNLPYVLLVLVAVAGVAYISLKKKAYNA